MNAIVYQLGSEGHRGTAAVRRLVEYAPGTGSLALWMQHRDVETMPDARDLRSTRSASPIANDGLTLFYLPAFCALGLREQTGLVAHQVLHVALRHVSRRETLARQIGPVDERLWNGAADAIVNASLSHLDWLGLPPGSVRLDELLMRSLAIEAPLASSLHRWDTESLYRAIDDRDRGASSARQGRRATGQGVTDRDGGRAPAPDTDSPAEDGPKAAAARELFRSMLPDLLPGEHESPDALARNDRDWQQRLGRAHVADGARSLLRELGADQRPTRTPWQLHLRTRLARAMNDQPELSWSRPSRSWLANRGRTASGRRLPWEPGTGSQRAAPRLVVLVDVSGSVDDDLLRRFGREMARVQRLHRAALWLIAGDDRVRCERSIEIGRQAFDDLPLQGGDGTDFRPLLAAAARHRPDLAIVLTDLDGPAGQAPGFPVLWATPRDSDRPTPFGTRLWLD